MTACATRAKLASYWLGDLDADEAAALEEHLFACDQCLAESERFADLVQGIRHERRVRSLPIAITRADWDALIADGFAVESIAARTDERARLIFPATTEVVIVRLKVPGAAAASYSLEVTGDDFRHEEPDVPTEHGEVLVACRNHFMREARAVTFRLFEATSVGRRLAGEFVVDHQRPG
jgi:anti-sigma factor RsiW